MASVVRNKKPAFESRIIPKSLWESPAAMVCMPQECSARTVVSLVSGQRMAKSVMVPSSATTSSLQNNVGQPSFSMRGLANCSKVSEMMMTWVRLRSSSKNARAPGMGSIFAMVACTSGRPSPCSARTSRRHFMSLS